MTTYAADVLALAPGNPKRVNIFKLIFCVCEHRKKFNQLAELHTN